MIRQRVLVADDVVENRQLVADFLDEVDCDLAMVDSGEAALEAMRSSRADLVLLDVEMPGLSGLEVCRRLKREAETGMVPVVMVTAYGAPEDRVAALEAGADDILTKPVNQTELVARVKSLLRINKLHQSLVQTEQVVFALARAVEAKDGFTEAHSERVAVNARRLAEAAGLSADEVAATEFAARVHDIGKIGVPDAILQKKDALCADEAAVMRNVPALGAEICAPLNTPPGLETTIRHQRERVDGTGYPDGLSGDEIPEPARILAICDAYDAMVGGERADRPRMALEKARLVIERQGGRAYDARLVRLFFEQVAPPAGAGAVPPA